jgi:hypothetical protein
MVETTVKVLIDKLLCLSKHTSTFLKDAGIRIISIILNTIPIQPACFALLLLRWHLNPWVLFYHSQ